MRRSERDRLLGFARGLSRAGVWFSGALMVGAAGLVGVDVVARKVFNVSVGGADEVSGYVLAIGSAWAFGYALVERAHVRIDSLYVHLPRRLYALLDLLGLVLFTGFMALVTWYAGGVLRMSAAVGARSLTPLATPQIIPQTLWVIGMLSVVLVGTLLLVRALEAFVRGRDAELARLIGSRTVTEELAEELEEELQARARR